MTIQQEIGSAVGGFLSTVFGNPMVQTALAAAGWALVVVWLLTLYWVFRDALARTRNPIVVLGAASGVAVATPAAFPLALLIWRILRPGKTLAERREDALTSRALEAAAGGPTCGGCGAGISAEWRRCPWCRTWLLAPCPRCDRLVEVDAAACPWCSLDVVPGMLMPRPATPALVPVMDAGVGPGVPVLAPAIAAPLAPAAFDAAPVDPARLDPPGIEPRGARQSGSRVPLMGSTGDERAPAWAAVPSAPEPGPGPAPTATLLAALSRGRELLRRAAAPLEAREAPAGVDAADEDDDEQARGSTALW